MRKIADEKANKNLNKKVFKEGEWVTIEKLPHPPSIANNWERRQGPYQIVARFGVVYMLRDIKGNYLDRNIHGDRLMPYYFSENNYGILNKCDHALFSSENENNNISQDLNNNTQVINHPIVINNTNTEPKNYENINTFQDNSYDIENNLLGDTDEIPLRQLLENNINNYENEMDDTPLIQLLENNNNYENDESDNTPLIQLIEENNNNLMKI